MLTYPYLLVNCWIPFAAVDAHRDIRDDVLSQLLDILDERGFHVFGEQQLGL